MASVFGRKFLGYSLWVAPGGVVKRKVAAKAAGGVQAVASGELTRRSGGRSMQEVVERLRPYVLGWKAYFRLGANARRLARAGRMDASPAARHPAQTLAAWHDHLPGTAQRWVQVRCSARQVAANSRRWWRNSDRALNRVLDYRLLRPTGRTSTLLTSTSRTARCGPACRVVWQGNGLCWPSPMPIFGRFYPYKTTGSRWNLPR